MEKITFAKKFFLLLFCLTVCTVVTAQTSFPDTDGDLITDEQDLDDDNDGILDGMEQSACLVSPVAKQTETIFLNETFGAGTTKSDINDNLSTASTTYTYEDGASGGSVNDGLYTVYYSISDGVAPVDISATGPDVANWADTRWYAGGDHTGDTNGKMAIFNASIAPGIFYQSEINGILPDVAIDYSFWVMNIDNKDDTFLLPGELPRKLPNLTVEFLSTDLATTLFTFNTGDITRCAGAQGDPSDPDYNECEVSSWKQFSLNTVVLGVTDFVVRFVNNGPGGAGNDLALDDIVIKQTLCDTDNDGVADVYDLDNDNDGIPNLVEAGFASLSNGSGIVDPALWVDLDGNGVHDAIDAAASDPNYLPDTDGDGIPDYKDIDSDNDGLFDIDEAGYGDGDVTGDGVGDSAESDGDGIRDIFDNFNGFGNAGQIPATDSDLDMIPDHLEIDSDDDSTFDIVGTLYESLDANNDGELDDSGDLDKDGSFNAFDTNTSVFGAPRDLNRKLSLYFDGRNDYIDDSPILGGLSQATLMSWVRLAPTFSDIGFVAGQNRFHIRINSNRRLNAIVNGGSLTAPSATALPLNEWVHVAAVYDSGDPIEKLKLFINGVKVATSNSSAVSGGIGSSTNNFTIGRNPGSTIPSTAYYFKGNLDEIRVFDAALLEEQLQEMVYQRIEDNTGIIKGEVLEKDILSTSWSSMLRYYEMDNIQDDQLKDLSSNLSDATLYNIKEIQVETTPLPFVTDTSGDILSSINVDGQNSDQLMTSEHAILKVMNDVTQNEEIKLTGLIIGDGVKLSVGNEKLLQTNHYLKIDGVLELQGESQLIQTANSIYANSSTGVLQRGQEGTADQYSYNYFSSPVSTTATGFETGKLKTANGLVQWTSSVDPPVSQTTPITLSNRWLWKFINGASEDYNAWIYLGNTGVVEPGLGFSMKGPGTGAILDEQAYVFEGTPNNGDITQPLGANNQTLVGNPYPSAIDAFQFIDDNLSISGGDALNGTLYFWEHMGGASHDLAEYQGGYGTLTKSGGVKAPSIFDGSGFITAKKRPGRYIPVAQGFFVEADADGGTIRFNNDQRVFELEGTDLLGDDSTFIRGASAARENENVVRRIRIGFENELGYHRQLLLAIIPSTTDGVDYGYDGALIEEQVDDLFWTIENQSYIIQAIGEASSFTNLPLGMNIGSDQQVTLMIDELENIDDTFEIYIRDNETGQIFDLRLGDFEIPVQAGVNSSRFSMVFQGNVLSNEEEKPLEGMDVFYDSANEELVLRNGKKEQINAVDIVNLLGQTVQTVNFNTIESEYKFSVQGNTGAYIAVVKGKNGQVTKKFVKQ